LRHIVWQRLSTPRETVLHFCVLPRHYRPNGVDLAPRYPANARMLARTAPEARGASLLSIASTLVCALGFVSNAISQPLEVAAAAELQRWTEGPQPPFILPSTSGADVALDSARSQVVLVHFFATWCEPCREELPALDRLAARANGTVKVLAISVADVDLSVRRFVEAMPVDLSRAARPRPRGDKGVEGRHVAHYFCARRRSATTAFRGSRICLGQDRSGQVLRNAHMGAVGVRNNRNSRQPLPARRMICISTDVTS
jgi:thiol-disulfide isomerase/thioredoxin